LLRFKTVERRVTAAPARNNQFPQIRLHRSADKRMALQNEYGFLDQPDRLQRGLRIALDKERVQPLKIGESTPGVDQARQDFAFGRFGCLPPARFRRYA
jgi:hypothetical protein